MPFEHAKEIKDSYVQLGELCKEFGFGVYVPHLYNDPAKMQFVTNADVYNMDSTHVKNAALVIANLDYASHGVGMELEIAGQNQVPLIAIYKKGRKVSRMALGFPALTKIIVYDDWQNLENQLREFLHKFSVAVLKQPS